jgi:hypothetical protein
VRHGVVLLSACAAFCLLCASATRACGGQGGWIGGALLSTRARARGSTAVGGFGRVKGGRARAMCVEAAERRDGCSIRLRGGGLCARVLRRRACV